MSVNVVTHLNFQGRAREALTFYASVFGGEARWVTYRAAHVSRPEQELDNIMWGQVQAPDGFRIMAYDTPADREWHAGSNAFFVVVMSESSDELQAIWHGLNDGATVLAPLGASAWSPLYGMIRDQFGITWVVTQEATE